MEYHSYSRQLCDVIIEVEETGIHAHKSMLCELSPYFRALFERWSSPEKILYIIPGVAPDIMKSIIQYGYSQQIIITRENVKALLEAADYLLVNDIVHLCCQFLVKPLCPENRFGKLQLANVHSWQELHDWATFMVEQSWIYRHILSNLPGMGDRSGRRQETSNTIHTASLK